MRRRLVVRELGLPVSLVSTAYLDRLRFRMYHRKRFPPSKLTPWQKPHSPLPRTHRSTPTGDAVCCVTPQRFLAERSADGSASWGSAGSIAGGPYAATALGVEANGESIATAANLT